jgi:GTP cyclohydrolase I
MSAGRPVNEIERAEVARHVEAVLTAYGVPVHDAEIRGTPARVAEMLGELLRGYDSDAAPHITPIANADLAGGLMVARALPFYALCAHHLLPFFGRAHLGYLPAERLAGLGDLARVVDAFSRRLTLQESLTAAIATHLESALAPRGVAVLLEGRHLCLEMRGQRRRARVESSIFRGAMDEPARRAEFLARVAARARR